MSYCIYFCWTNVRLGAEAPCSSCQDGLAFQNDSIVGPRAVLVLVLGNKMGMKFMLLRFWHEVAPAPDGMA